MTVDQHDAAEPRPGPGAPFPRHGLLMAACRHPLGLLALIGAILSASVLILGEGLIGAAFPPIRQYGLAALCATSALFVWVLLRIASAGADPGDVARLGSRPPREPPALEGERWRTLGDERLEAGDPDLAAAAWDRALSLARGAADHLGQAAADRRLAALARRRGDPVQAEARLRRAYDCSASASDAYGMAVALIDLADLARDAGRDELARRHLEEAQELLLGIGAVIGPEAEALLRSDRQDRPSQDGS